MNFESRRCTVTTQKKKKQCLRLNFLGDKHKPKPAPITKQEAKHWQPKWVNPLDDILPRRLVFLGFLHRWWLVWEPKLPQQQALGTKAMQRELAKEARALARSEVRKLLARKGAADGAGDGAEGGSWGSADASNRSKKKRQRRRDVLQALAGGTGA